MSEWFVPETFFRPAELGREAWSIPAHVYNTCRRMLSGSRAECVFVPIRNMQYQAVVDRREVIFVDSQGGYRVQEGEGGRLITLAWQPRPYPGRDSLTEPVPCDIVYYERHPKELMWRLAGEFSTAIKALEQRQRTREPSSVGARILPLRLK